MTRTMLIVVFALSCLLLLSLSAWFYFRQERLLALALLIMVPAEIAAGFGVDRVLSRRTDYR